MQENRDKQAPFLKWAGGKRWLADNYAELFEIEFERFIEPFLGSGAIFFHVRPQKAILSDSNDRLIETYRAVKEQHAKVEQHLRRHQKNHSKEYYYRLRDQRPRSMAGRAAQIIYLNRTCWNGLYRVNRQGEFNVPIGTKDSVLLPTDNFACVATSLSSATLRACDFERTMLKAGEGDFVFVDPPYTVKHNNNGFIKYNQGLFSWDDQIRLRDSVAEAAARGAKVLATNADHASIRKLYKGLGKIRRVSRASVLAAKAAHRGTCTEMVIKCY